MAIPADGRPSASHPRARERGYPLLDLLLRHTEQPEAGSSQTLRRLMDSRMSPSLPVEVTLPLRDRDRLNREQFAPDLGPGQTGRHTDMIDFLRLAEAIAADAGELLKIRRVTTTSRGPSSRFP